MLGNPINEVEYDKGKEIEGRVLQASDIIANQIINCLSAQLKEIVERLNKHEELLNLLFNKEKDIQINNTDDDVSENSDDSFTMKRQKTDINFNANETLKDDRL